MIRGPSRLPLTSLYRIARLHRAKRNVRVHRRAPLAVVGDPHGELARLDKLVSKRSTYAIACQPYRARLKGCEVKKPAEAVTLSSEEGEALIARVHQNTLSPADASLVERIIRTHFWLVLARQETQITVKRLRSLLFGKRLKPSPAPEDSSAPSPAGGDETNACAVLEADGGDADATAGEAPPDASQTPERVKPKGGHRPGTGRLGAAAYAGATRIECRHEELAVGQRCPVCGQGNRYQWPAGVEIRVDGKALLSAIPYELEKLRCSACGEIFTAGLPAGVGDEKDSAQARAVLAVSRSYLGVPSYRLQGYQAMRGGPVPDATQWDEIEVVGDCAYKVFAQMEREAAQGERIFQDDTAGRIVSLIKENRDLLAQPQGLSTTTERTGMHTTALAVQVGEHTAILSSSRRRHAGENLQRLLDKRETGLDKPLAMSEALSSKEVSDASMLIRCHCLAHGRRKFSDLEAVFPRECQVVLEVMSQVFDHDEQARQEQLSPEARLAYPQAQSRPLMDELTGWLDKQIDDHLVEPNSSLGNAIGSMRTHGETLTRCVTPPGAPLDNNVAERLLKLGIRQRKNSRFYKSPHSASIASVLPSLIATCLYGGGNAVEDLVALPEPRREVFAAPAAWLPWGYARSRASP